MKNAIINTTLLKQYSVLPLNYSTKEIENFVNIAQTIWIIPIIGQDFFDELLEQVENDDVSEENATALVEAIYPYLGLAVAYEALPTMAYHVSEVGLTKGKSENSDALDLKELAYYEQFLRRQLEAAKDHCKKWLCQHSDSFPALDCCQCGCASCQDGRGKLNKPNPYKQVYSTPRWCTNLM